MTRPALPRFLITEHTPVDGPLFAAAEAWADFERNLEANRRGIIEVIGRVKTDHIRASIARNQQVQGTRQEVEDALGEGFSEFMTATSGLRLAINVLHGHRLMWNHYFPSEVAGSDQPATDLESKWQTRTAPETYPIAFGYLVGNHIGLNAATMNFEARLTVAGAPDGLSMYYSLFDMFAIGLADVDN